MVYETEFARFTRRREVLNQRLDATRAELDAWIAENAGQSAATAGLAYLEGLLATRSRIFQELKDLDDSLVDFLLRLRHKPSDGGA